MILSEQNLKPEALLRFFKKYFPEKDWFFLDMYSDDETTHYLKANSMGFYTVLGSAKTFPVEVHLTEVDEEIITEYQTKIAKALSEKYHIKTVIDFTHPEKPEDPFYSLLFDDGACFLADHSEWEDNEEFIVLEPWSI
jgi:hypothetical protein